MRDFLKHTKDAYEQRYGKIVCQNFEGYAEFWNKYIGQRKDNFLKHYEIDSSKTGINNFDKKYENMTLAHYGIFVDLATIRIDLDIISKNPYRSVDDKLSYWNAVRNIYSKMGDSIYKYQTFLDNVKDVLNIGKITDPIIKRLKKDLQLIKDKRDYMSHFTTIPFAQDKLGEIKKIPRRIYDGTKRLPYSEILKQDPKYWISVEVQIQHDLEEIETKFNMAHEEVLELFQKHKRFFIIDPGEMSVTSNLKSTDELGTSASGSSMSSGDQSIM